MPFYAMDDPTPVVRTALVEAKGAPFDGLDPDLAFWRQVQIPVWPFAGAPTTGTWPQGWIGVDNTSTMWICTVGGTPGTWATVGGSPSPASAFANSGLWYLDPRYPVSVGGVAQWTAATYTGVLGTDDFPAFRDMLTFANSLSHIPMIVLPAGAFRLSQQINWNKCGWMGLGSTEHDVQCFYDGPSNAGPFAKTNGSFGDMSGVTFRPGTTPQFASYLDMSGAASCDYGCWLDACVFSEDGETGALIDVITPPVWVNLHWGKRKPLRFNNPVVAGVKFTPSAGTVTSYGDIECSMGTSNHLPANSLTGPLFFLDNSAGAHLGWIRVGGERIEQNQQTNAFKITDGNNTGTPLTMLSAQIPAFATTAGLVGMPVSFPGIYPTGTKISTINAGSFTVTTPGGSVTQTTGITGTVGVTGLIRLLAANGRVNIAITKTGYQPGGSNSAFASLVYAESPASSSINQTLRLRLDELSITPGQLATVLDGDVPTMDVAPVQATYSDLAIGAKVTASEVDAIFGSINILSGLTFSQSQSYAIVGAISAGVQPQFFVPVPAGMTATVLGVRAVLQSGTSVAVAVQRNAVTIPGLGAVVVTTAPATVNASPPLALADADAIGIVLSSPTGSPVGLSVSVLIQYAVMT
jgi:hypothetical protein